LIHTAHTTICVLLYVCVNFDTQQSENQTMSNVLITKTTIKEIIASFVEAKTEENKALLKATAIRDKAIQKVVDAMLVKRGTQATKDFLKGNAATNPARLAVKNLFDALVEKKLIQAATAKSYATNFWIAFETNVIFSTTLSNKKSQAKNEKGAQTGKGLTAEKATVTKAGKVETTDRAALVQTLTKAFEQSQILIKAGDTQLTLLAASLETMTKELSAPF
jgi:hypothetical protein